MTKKYVFIFCILSMIFCSSYNVFCTPILDLSKSYTIPKVVRPYTNIVYFVYVTNPFQYSLSNLELKFYAPSCMKITSDSKWEFSYVYPQQVYVVPLKIKVENCKDGVYWITTKISYSDNQGYKESKEYIPLTIVSKGTLVISNVYTNPSYVTSFSTFDLTLVLHNNKNTSLRNVQVFLNPLNDCAVILSPNYKYINEIPANSSYEVTFKLKSTNIPCVFKANVMYEDELGNIYNSTVVFGVDVKNTLPSLSLRNTTITVKNDQNLFSIELRNNGNEVVSNIVIKILSSPESSLSFDPSEFYIDNLYPNNVKKIVGRVFVDPSANGVYKVPVIITYTDNSGRVYNATYYLTFKVVKRPDLILYISEAHSNRVTISIANIGNVPAKNVYITLNYCKGCSFTGKQSEFIGDLDEGDYETADFDINAYSNVIKVKGVLFFEDKLGNEYKKSFNLTVSIPVSELPIPVNSKTSNYTIVGIVVGIILVVMGGLLIVLHRRRSA